MIQFNLLPDVKLEFIKAQRTKRLVMTISTLTSIAAVVVLILLVIGVEVVQKKNLSDLNHDIKSNVAKLQDQPDLTKVLTIQNQLSALESLHNAKPAVGRLFGYLQQVTPSQSTISNITIDYGANTMTLTGAANSLDTVNTFVDTLKFTTYTSSSQTTTTKAFSAVVLSSFGQTASSATYSVTLSFDPNIFSNTDSPALTVPNTVTTRSVTDQPSDLFKSTSKAGQ